MDQPLSEVALQILVTRAQDGDAGAFEEIYNTFFVQVYRYVAFRSPTEVAEDLVADIFVKAWEKLHTYKAQKNIPFGAWIFRIARHTVVDFYRKQHHMEELSDELADPDTLNRADTAVIHKDLLRMVRSALAKLPRRYREVLLLSYIAELSHDEVARVLKMSEGGVRILKFRALKKLQGLLPSEAAEHASPSRAMPTGVSLPALESDF